MIGIFTNLLSKASKTKSGTKGLIDFSRNLKGGSGLINTMGASVIAAGKANNKSPFGDYVRKMKSKFGGAVNFRKMISNGDIGVWQSLTGAVGFYEIYDLVFGDSVNEDRRDELIAAIEATKKSNPELTKSLLTELDSLQRTMIANGETDNDEIKDVNSYRKNQHMGRDLTLSKSGKKSNKKTSVLSNTRTEKKRYTVKEYERLKQESAFMREFFGSSKDVKMFKRIIFAKENYVANVIDAKEYSYTMEEIDLMRNDLVFLIGIFGSVERVRIFYNIMSQGENYLERIVSYIGDNK